MTLMSSSALAELLRRRLQAARGGRGRLDALLYGRQGEFLWVRSPGCAELLPEGPVQMTAYAAEPHNLVTIVLDAARRRELAVALWPEDLVPAVELLPERSDVETEPLSLLGWMRHRTTDGGAGWLE